MRDQPCMSSKGFPCPSTNDYRFRDYSAELQYDNKRVYRRIKGVSLIILVSPSLTRCGDVKKYNQKVSRA